MSFSKIRTLIARAGTAPPAEARRLYAEADDLAIESRPQVVHAKRTGIAVVVAVGQDGSLDLAYGKRVVQAHLRDVQLAPVETEVAA